MTFRTRLLLAVAALAAVAVCVGPAQSAFPGANGKIVFASDRDGAQDVYVMTANGVSQRRLTNTDGDDQYPMWSPDGNQIVFSSARETASSAFGNDKIFRMNADGSAQTRVIDSAFHDLEPSWSPNMARIAFRSDRDGGSHIFAMNADGTGLQRLTDVGFDLNPVWSPTGDSIAFTSDRDGDFDIYTMSASGGPATKLTDNAAFDSNPDWSPLGTHIAFQSNRDSDFDIYTMAADGTNLTQLTNEPAFDSAPTWSPDGTKLAFQSNRDGDFEIYRIDFAPVGLTQLTHNTATDRVADWQPLAPGADVTPPALTLPADMTVLATSPAGAVVSFAVSATDNVDPNPTVTCSHASGTTFAIGTARVSCTASDASGNWTDGSFRVTVESPPNTPTGTNVVVTPVDAATGSTPVTITFLVVLTEGLTTLTTSSSGPPPPPNFEVAGAYYSLATTAEFEIEAEVCFQIVPPDAPTIAHWVGDPPVLSTPATYYKDVAGPDGAIVSPGEGNYACALVTSFSPFALLLPVSGGDATPPVLSLPGNITADATSPAGAVVSFTVTASDDVDPNPIVECSPATGATFVIGTTTVSCTATDQTGNVGSGSFSVTVLGAKAQLSRLIEKVVNASSLPPALKTQLIAKLQALVAGFDPSNAKQKKAVCVALNIFKGVVQALSGRGIPPAQAAEWIADANRIRAVLGC